MANTYNAARQIKKPVFSKKDSLIIASEGIKSIEFRQFPIENASKRKSPNALLILLEAQRNLSDFDFPITRNNLCLHRSEVRKGKTLIGDLYKCRNECAVIDGVKVLYCREHLPCVCNTGADDRRCSGTNSKLSKHNPGCGNLKYRCRNITQACATHGCKTYRTNIAQSNEFEISQDAPLSHEPELFEEEDIMRIDPLTTSTNEDDEQEVYISQPNHFGPLITSTKEELEDNIPINFPLITSTNTSSICSNSMLELNTSSPPPSLFEFKIESSSPSNADQATEGFTEGVTEPHEEPHTEPIVEQVAEQQEVELGAFTRKKTKDLQLVNISINDLEERIKLMDPAIRKQSQENRAVSMLKEAKINLTEREFPSDRSNQCLHRSQIRSGQILVGEMFKCKGECVTLCGVRVPYCSEHTPCFCHSAPEDRRCIRINARLDRHFPGCNNLKFRCSGKCTDGSQTCSFHSKEAAAAGVSVSRKNQGIQNHSPPKKVNGEKRKKKEIQDLYRDCGNVYMYEYPSSQSVDDSATPKLLFQHTSTLPKREAALKSKEKMTRYSSEIFQPEQIFKKRKPLTESHNRKHLYETNVVPVMVSDYESNVLTSSIPPSPPPTSLSMEQLESMSLQVLLQMSKTGN